VQFRRPVFLAMLTSASLLSAQQPTLMAHALDPQDHLLTTVEQANSHQLSGTVVDTSGAVIAGADVHLLSSSGAVQRAIQSDKNGAFQIPGIAGGRYRLVVSNPGFETKEILVTIGTTGTPAPLHISLVVGSVSTTVNVQGREDDLIGIADRFFVREKFWRRFPASSSRSTRVAARPTSTFFAASISTTAPILQSSSTICR